MTPELAYEKRYAAVDNGAHTWAVAPQHVKEMWLAAWTIGAAAERERLLAELRTMHAQQNGRHNYYLYAAELLDGKL